MEKESSALQLRGVLDCLATREGIVQNALCYPIEDTP